MSLDNKKIKVLVVDDSSLMRRIIVDILNKHPLVERVDYAINGKAALGKIKLLKPDVITLDVEMPIMNGLETLEELNKISPTPVVMLSSLTKAGADVTIQALELGAVDFITKPQTSKYDFSSLEEEICSKVISASKIKLTELLKFQLNNKREIKKIYKPFIKKATRVKTVIIGSSTGGPQALKSVVPYLPDDLPAQFLIVQHMPPSFTGMLAKRLDSMSYIQVKEAEENDFLEAGKALLAPGNFHMGIKVGNKVGLYQTKHICGVRPAVDFTLMSASDVFKEDVISVILTGMGHDGTNGTSYVKRQGGYCIAEDKSTSVIYGMPKSVIEKNLANQICPVHEVADAIVKAVYR